MLTSKSKSRPLTSLLFGSLALSLALAGCVPESDPSGGGGSAGRSAGAGGAAGGSGGGGTYPDPDSKAGAGGTSAGGAGGTSSGGAAGAGTGGSPSSSSGGSGGSPAGGVSGGGGGGGGLTGGGEGGTGGASTAVDAGAESGPAAPPGGGYNGPFTCTLLIGINATAEWYDAGFETMVDNAKWELIRVHSGFVDLWANPSSNFWSTNPTSACATNAKNPDRVIFVGLRFEWTSVDQWETALKGVVKNIKDKFPGVKSIELATFVRAPGNKPCPQAPAHRSTIHPSADEAIAKVVATDPVLLKASPKFEAMSCSDFTGNPPHFGAAGSKKVAQMIAAHYGTAQ